MTQLIESTSSAPTLREWAIAEWQRKVAEYDARERQEHAADFKRRVDVLRIYLRDKIGLSDEESIQIVATSDVSSGFIATTADGLRFTLKDLPYADSGRDRERLHVSVDCSRGCGKDLWVNVESLDDLGGVLQPDATNTHEFGCLQKFDDDGDAITDGMGNPLPPPSTPVPTASERVASIEGAAVNVCFAIRHEQQAIDDRDAMLSALVNSLIGQPNPLTNKEHSATSAEKAAKETEQYKAAEAERINAECKRILAWADYERAKLAARLAVAVMEDS